MNKVVIVTNFTSDKMILKYKDYPLIGVENGINKILNLGLIPIFCISDFDSIPFENIKDSVDENKIIKLPKEKDYSDTEFALIQAIKQYKFDDITILCSLSKRYDHSHALLLLLKKYASNNVCLIDENNEIRYFNKGSYLLDKKDYKYLGLFGFPFCNVTVDGVYYKVENMEISFTETKAISNSFISENIKVKVNDGNLLLVFSKDE